MCLELTQRRLAACRARRVEQLSARAVRGIRVCQTCMMCVSRNRTLQERLAELKEILAEEEATKAQLKVLLPLIALRLHTCQVLCDSVSGSHHDHSCRSGY